MIDKGDELNEELGNSIISDTFAEELIVEPKYYDSKTTLFELKPVADARHKKADIALICEKYNHAVSMTIRQSTICALNFSVVLRYKDQNKNTYNLIRYNGDHGSHTNTLTNKIITGPHIHRITEEYQKNTTRPEGYAVATDKYVDLNQAIAIFLKDMNISVKRPPNTPKLEDW